MKLLNLILTCLLSFNIAHSQETRPLDTIYANDQKNVALFFPEPITQGIVGNENFVFTFNRDQEQYFGLLQAKPGKSSNLLVINRDGSVFSFIIQYKENLTKLNYFLSESDNIGNERPIPENQIKDKEPSNRTEPQNRYRTLCSLFLKRNQRIGRIRKRSQRIILSLQNLVFHEDELYFVIQIENRSNLDYDLNFLKMAIETKKKGKKKSLQTLYKEPILKYHWPERIAKKSSRTLVYVLPKFSLGRDHRVVLELNEKNGGRNVKLNVSHRFINNPN